MNKNGTPENLVAKGRIAHMTPEERKEISRKGGLAAAAKRRERAEWERRLQDKDKVLKEATAAVMADNPDIVSKIMENLARIASDSEAKGNLVAADMFLKHAGITNTNKSEVKVEDKKMSEEEAVALLRGKIKVVGEG